MALSPFTWGSAGQKLTPAQAKARRDVANALLANNQAATTFGGGLAKIGDALKGIHYERQADEAEQAGSESRKAIMDALMSNADPTMNDIYGAIGDPWVASDPASSAILQAMMAQEMQENDPLRQLQIEKGRLELDQLRNAPPPMPDAPTVKTIFDPETGREQVVQWTGAGWEPIGGVEAESGPLVQVNTGDGAPGLGKLSTDYGYVLDPATGQPRIDPETGLPTAAPVPGSPAALEAAAAAAKAEITEGRQDTATDTIINAASVARELAGKGATTGVGGAVLANISETEAAELRRQVDVLKSVASIENLTAMRQASPTGGALGSVTERENAMLAAAAGAIDPNARKEDFQRQLDNYERTLLRIVHGPAEGDRIFEETRGPQTGDAADPRYQADEPPADWGGDPALWRFMSPEDRALW